MKINLCCLLIVLLTCCKQSSKSPEEIAVDYLMSDIVGSDIFNYDLNSTDTALIILPPILHKEFYENGFLTDLSIKCEGFAYGSFGNCPYSDFKTNIEMGYDSIDATKYARIRDFCFDQISTGSLDTIKINMPSSIQEISLLKEDLNLEDKTLFMRVHRAIYTDHEYLVRIVLWRNYINQFEFDQGCIIYVELDKSMNPVSWEFGGIH